MYLKDRSDAGGKCWPSQKTIAAGLNLSVSTVQRALSELERKEYITHLQRFRTNGGRTSNLYSITQGKKPPP